MIDRTMLDRANLNVIEEFILTGFTSNMKPSEKKYSERLMDVENKISEYMNMHEKMVPECAELWKCFSEQSEVYFELGIIIGAKIAFQLQKRIEEI